MNASRFGYLHRQLPRRHRKAVALLFVVVFTFMTSSAQISTNAYISSMTVSIDVLSVEEENVLVTQTVEHGFEGKCIPLINSLYEVNYSIISIVDNRGGEYVGEIEGGCLMLTPQPSQESVIIIRYMINGLIEEISPFQYVLALNTTGFENTTHRITLSIPKHYAINPLLPASLKIDRNNNWFIIEINTPDIYIILITAPYGPETPKPGDKDSTASRNTTFIVIIGASIVVSIVTFYFLKLKKRGVEVETIPPDVLNDDVAKMIIRYVGDKGGEGVKQSELQSVVNRPKSIISRRVKRLAEEGYLEVTPKGRYNIVGLTDRGWRAYRDLKKSN